MHHWGRRGSPPPNVTATGPTLPRPGLFSGRLPLVHGKPSLLVIYHYAEAPGTCPEDEEVAVIRSNLLLFLRQALPSGSFPMPVMPSDCL